MPPDPSLIVLPAAIGIPAAVVLAFRWFRHREHMATLAPPPEPTPALDARRAHLDRVEAQLEHVTRAVEAMAVEVERISEGQRFVTKLLAERPPALPDVPLPQRGRVVTPH